MHIFEGRYFNINRRFLMCIGLWPYEEKTRKYVLQTIFICVLIIGNLAQLISMILHYKNTDRLMLSILCFCVVSVITCKAVATILAEENMKLVHRNIASNWERIQDCCERDILYKYSERARRVTIFIIAFTVTTSLMVTLLPLIPKILDFLKPRENPRPSIYISAGDLFLDRETHFLPYFILEGTVIMLMAFVVVTVDTTYIVTIEQSCALYAIIRSRLLKLRSKSQKKSSRTEDIDSYEWLCRIIKIHQDALIFSSLLNKSYSKVFMIVAISALFVVPFASCAIIANLDNSLQLFPYATFLINATMHGFIICYPGQRVLDHQLRLLDAAYYNEWYATPLRTKKLLLIFIIRCSDPVMITAGNLVPTDLQIYFKIMKTSASYITVASSFR